MKVFISWSGERSRELAEVFRDWIPSAFQFVEPYFTPSDIDKGKHWSSEIFTNLSASKVCLIILTKENLSSSWIMFEAGAISAVIEKSRVCPIVFGIEPTDVQGPLTQFQITKFNKKDMRALCHSLNNAADEAGLSAGVFSSVFDKWWSDLEEKISALTTQPESGPSSSEEVRSDRDLINEILTLLRNQQISNDKALVSALTYTDTVYHKLWEVMQKLWLDAGLTIDETSAFIENLENLIKVVEARKNFTLRAGLVRDLKKTLASAISFRESLFAESKS